MSKALSSQLKLIRKKRSALNSGDMDEYRRLSSATYKLDGEDEAEEEVSLEPTDTEPVVEEESSEVVSPSLPPVEPSSTTSLEPIPAPLEPLQAGEIPGAGSPSFVELSEMSGDGAFRTSFSYLQDFVLGNAREGGINAAAPMDENRGEIALGQAENAAIGGAVLASGGTAAVPIAAVMGAMALYPSVLMLSDDVLGTNFSESGLGFGGDPLDPTQWIGGLVFPRTIAQDLQDRKDRKILESFPPGSPQALAAAERLKVTDRSDAIADVVMRNNPGEVASGWTNDRAYAADFINAASQVDDLNYKGKTLTMGRDLASADEAIRARFSGVLDRDEIPPLFYQVDTMGRGQEAGINMAGTIRKLQSATIDRIHKEQPGLTISEVKEEARRFVSGEVQEALLGHPFAQGIAIIDIGDDDAIEELMELEEVWGEGYGELGRLVAQTLVPFRAVLTPNKLTEKMGLMSPEQISTESNLLTGGRLLNVAPSTMIAAGAKFGYYPVVGPWLAKMGIIDPESAVAPDPEKVLRWLSEGGDAIDAAPHFARAMYDHMYPDFMPGSDTWNEYSEVAMKKYPLWFQGVPILATMIFEPDPVSLFLGPVGKLAKMGTKSAKLIKLYKMQRVLQDDAIPRLLALESKLDPFAVEGLDELGNTTRTFKNVPEEVEAEQAQEIERVIRDVLNAASDDPEIQQVLELNILRNLGANTAAQVKEQWQASVVARRALAELKAKTTLGMDDAEQALGLELRGLEAEGKVADGTLELSTSKLRMVVESLRDVMPEFFEGNGLSIKKVKRLSRKRLQGTIERATTQTQEFSQALETVTLNSAEAFSSETALFARLQKQKVLLEQAQEITRRGLQLHDEVVVKFGDVPVTGKYLRHEEVDGVKRTFVQLATAEGPVVRHYDVKDVAFDFDGMVQRLNPAYGIPTSKMGRRFKELARASFFKEVEGAFTAADGSIWVPASSLGSLKAGQTVRWLDNGELKSVEEMTVRSTETIKDATDRVLIYSGTKKKPGMLVDVPLDEVFTLKHRDVEGQLDGIMAITEARARASVRHLGEEVTEEATNAWYARNFKGFATDLKGEVKPLVAGDDVAAQGDVLDDIMYQGPATAGAATAVEAVEAARLWKELGTESPYFKKWFGDSKIVGEDGKPLVVFHGSSWGGFTEFEELHSWHFFAGERSGAATYAGTNRPIDFTRKGYQRGIYDVYLRASNPFEVDYKGGMWDKPVTVVMGGKKVKFDNIEDLAEAAEEAGHDGVKVLNIKDFRNAKNEDVAGPEFIVFDNANIKSTSNKGTFDETGRILYQGADVVSPAKSWDEIEQKPVDFGKATASDVAAQIRKDVSGTKVASYIADNADSPVHRRIAERIKPFLKDTEVYVINNWDDVPKKFENLVDDYNAKSNEGRLKAMGDKQLINTINAFAHHPSRLNSITYGLTVSRAESRINDIILRGENTLLNGVGSEVILHELVHAATVRRIEDGRYKVNEGSKLGDATDRLIALNDTLVDRLSKMYRRGEGELPPGLTIEEVGKWLGDPNELVAYGLTNAKFQEYLKTVKLDKTSDKSLWSAFVETLADLLGLKGSDEVNALEELLQATDDLLEAPLKGLEKRSLTQLISKSEAPASVDDIVKVLFQEGAKHGDSYFDADKLSRLRDQVAQYGERETLVYLTPDEFLSMAARLSAPRETSVATVSKALSAGKKFYDIPFLRMKEDGTIFGHEGRHRAMALKALGVKRMPVRLMSDDIRWNEQLPSKMMEGGQKAWYWRETLPKQLTGQDGVTKMDAPFHAEGPNRGQVLPERRADLLRQGEEGSAKAAVQFVEDNKAILYAFEQADVSSLLHEIGHVFRRDLLRSGWQGKLDSDVLVRAFTSKNEDSRYFDRTTQFDGGEGAGWTDLTKAGKTRTPEEMDKIQGKRSRKRKAAIDKRAKGLEAQSGPATWTVKSEERFARAFEKYLATGRSPSLELDGVFKKFKSWMTEIYVKIRGSAIGRDVPKEVREVFDRMLTGAMTTEGYMKTFTVKQLRSKLEEQGIAYKGKDKKEALAKRLSAADLNRTAEYQRFIKRQDDTAKRAALATAKLAPAELKLVKSLEDELKPLEAKSTKAQKEILRLRTKHETARSRRNTAKQKLRLRNAYDEQKAAEKAILGTQKGLIDFTGTTANAADHLAKQLAKIDAASKKISDSDKAPRIRAAVEELGKLVELLQDERKVRLPRGNLLKHPILKSVIRDRANGTWVIDPKEFVDSVDKFYISGVLEEFLLTPAGAYLEPIVKAAREGGPNLTYTNKKMNALQVGLKKLEDAYRDGKLAQGTWAMHDQMWRAFRSGNFKKVRVPVPFSDMINGTGVQVGVPGSATKFFWDIYKKWDPSYSKYGELSKDLAKQASHHERFLEHAMGDLHNVNMTNLTGDFMGEHIRYMDTTEAIDGRYGSTMINTLGKGIFKEAQAFLRANLAATPAGKLGIAKGVSGEYVENLVTAIERTFLPRGKFKIQPRISDAESRRLRPKVLELLADESMTYDKFLRELGKEAGRTEFGRQDVRGITMTSRALIDAAAWQHTIRGIANTANAMLTPQQALQMTNFMEGKMDKVSDVDALWAAAAKLGMDLSEGKIRPGRTHGQSEKSFIKSLVKWNLDDGKLLSPEELVAHNTKLEATLREKGVSPEDIAAQLVVSGLKVSDPRQVFMPAHVGESMAEGNLKFVKELDQYYSNPKGFDPQSSAQKYVRMWKGMITSGLGLPRPKYYVNNIVGDHSQMWQNHGIYTATKVSAQNVLTNIPYIGPRIQNVTSKMAEKFSGIPVLGTAVEAVFNPQIGRIFKGEEGVIKLGDETVSLSTLRENLALDGVLDTFTSREVSANLKDAAAELLGDMEHQYGRSIPGKFKDIAIRKMKSDLDGFAVQVQQRQRVGLYLELRKQGLSHDGAVTGVKNALYDWSGGFSKWEQSWALGLFVPFYRFWKLAAKQLLQAGLEPFVMDSSEYMLKAMTGQTQLARMRTQARILGGIPTWAAYAEAEAAPDGEEGSAFWLSMLSSPWWKRPGMTSWGKGMTDDQRYFMLKNHDRDVDTIATAMSSPATAAEMYSLAAYVLTTLPAMASAAMDDDKKFNGFRAWKQFKKFSVDIGGPAVEAVWGEKRTSKTGYRRITPGEESALKLFGHLAEVHRDEDGRLVANEKVLALVNHLPVLSSQWPDLVNGLEWSKLFHGEDELLDRFLYALAHVSGPVRHYPSSTKSTLYFAKREMDKKLRAEVDAGTRGKDPQDKYIRLNELEELD